MTIPQILLTVVMALLAAFPARAGEENTIPVPLGATSLLDDPACTVGYQRFGEAPHTLGWRWSGYDPPSGVYFVPEAGEGGRRQVFMHCPWQAGPGVAFADFRLALPQTERIRLDVATAMRATAKGTDGVTFRVGVDGKPLWETHATWKTWQDAQVDLSPYAGRAVTLRLEVDPGPKRSTTDDWSLWGQAEIVAGTDAQVAEARAERAKEAAARRKAGLQRGARLADADLSAYSGGDAFSARPSTAGPVSTDLQSRDGECLFTCKAADETVEYRFVPERGLLDGLSVWVDGKRMDPTPFLGGPKVLLGGREYGPGSAGLTGRLVSAAREGATLTCRYEYRVEGAPETAALTAALSVEGKSLILALQGEADRFSGFLAAGGRGEDVPLPFVVGSAPRLHPAGVYFTAFPDLWHTDASGLGPVGQQYQTGYLPLTDGRRRALRDTFVLTVSRRFEETLANVANPPSPFLEELAGRVVLDAWGGSFAENEAWLREMARYGVNAFLIIKHVWQRDGYDRSYPNVMPANAAMGGDTGLSRLSRTARALGHRFSVHENFYDYYPNAEAFYLSDCALSARGEKIPGWDNGSVRALILKPSKLMEYARRFSPEVRRRYEPDAAYHDIMPTWHVDYDAGVSGSGILRRTHEITRDLCDYDRRLFGGPVVFEAMGDVLAGIFDGGCNHGVDTYRTPPMAAYELLKVHPKMSNHGFGYYERWLPWGYGAGWNTYVMTDRELDRYRATTIAFGRTGFVGQQLMKHPHGVVREYHLMQAFGRAYTGQRLARLAYFTDDAGWVDAATAARYQLWDRQRAEYEGGQRVYVNLSGQPWTVDGHALPPDGALTVGPRATAGTEIRGGQISDYARYGDVTYADARSHQWLPLGTAPPTPRTQGEPESGPHTIPPGFGGLGGLTPALGEWRDHGDGSVSLTVDWRVGRTPERDFTVFWHLKEGGAILQQSDHAPPAPTSRWQVGETVKDGPRRIALRTDQDATAYDVVVGLYDKAGRALLAHGADQVRIATLHVTRAGGKVTGIELRPVSDPPPPGAMREPYLVDANRARAVVDFGAVATDGAVVVRGAGSRREAVPVPIGEAMRVGLAGTVRRATPFDAESRRLRDLPLRRQGGKTWFDLPAGAARVAVE